MTLQSAIPLEDQAGALFRALFTKHFSKPARGGTVDRIAFRWEDNNKETRCEYFSDIYDASQRAVDLAYMGRDASFCVAPRTKRRLTKDAISNIVAVHLDYDGGNVEDERRILAALPTAAVRSGGGPHKIHAYWGLEDSKPAKTHARAVEMLNKRLAEEFSGDAGAFDISRQLRIPGTWNLKDRANPTQCELIALGPTYSFEELASRFGLPGGAFDTTLYDGGRAHSYVRPEDEQYLDRVLAHGLFEEVSRDRATLLLIRHCYGLGMSEDEIITCVTEFLESRHNGLSKDWLERPRWCIDNIKSKTKNWFVKAYRAPKKEIKPLCPSDVEYVDSLGIKGKWNRRFVEDAIAYIRAKGRDGVVILSSRTMQSFRGAGNGANYVKKCDLLLRLGILARLYPGDNFRLRAARYSYTLPALESDLNNNRATPKKVTSVNNRNPLPKFSESERNARRLALGLAPCEERKESGRKRVNKGVGSRERGRRVQEQNQEQTGQP